MSETTITTAAAIKQARQALGLTQEKLASVLKVSFPTVNRWENGKTQPDKRARHALADLIRAKAPDRASLADQIDGGRREPADDASVKPRKTQGRSRSRAGGTHPKRVKPPRPPITPADPLLPIADGEFLWQQFETFAEDYVKALTGAKVSRYGSRGQDQRGIDFYADEVDGRATYQCRQWKKFTKADAEAAVAETTYEGAERHVVLVTCEVGAGVRDLFEAAKGWEIRDIRDMSRDVSIGMPLGVAKRLLDKNFGGPWRRNFLKIDGLSTFLDAERFFGTLLEGDDLLSHAAEQVGRDDAMSGLDAFHESAEKQIAIVSGRGGIGKSRLLAAYADAHPAAEIRFVERGVTVMPAAVDELPLGDTVVIVVDDVHQRDDLGALLALQRQRPGTKLVLVTRSHGLEGLKTKLAAAPVDPKRILEVPRLVDLERSDTRKLVRSILADADDDVVERIARVARDSPLVAVVASRLLLRRSLDLGSLSRDDDFRQAALRRFHDELLGRVGDVQPELLAKFVRVAAAIGPFRAMQHDVATAIAAHLGVSAPEYTQLVDAAALGGVLLRRGYSYRLTPDVLADYVLDEACVKSGGTLTGYAEAIFRDFKIVAGAQVLRNLGEVEWRMRRDADDAVDVLSAVWGEVTEEFRTAGVLQRSQILDTITEVAPYQPDRALALVERAIAKPVETRTEWDDAFKFGEENVLRHVPEILRRVALNIEYLPQCADTLWRLGRDKPGRLPSETGHSIRILQDIAGYEIRKPLEFRKTLLDRIEVWVEEPGAHEHVHSVLDVIDPMLKRQGTHSSTEGFAWTLTPFFVNEVVTRPLRDRALRVIARVAAMSDTRAVIRAIGSYGDVLHEYGSGAFGQPLPDDYRDRWRPERLAVLSALEGIARKAKDPLVHLEILHAVQWYAFKESDASIRDAAKRVLDALPDTPDRQVTEMIIDAGGWRYRMDDASEDEKWVEHHETAADDRRRSTAEATIRRLTPEEFIAAANDRLATARLHGIDTSPQLFFAAIVHADRSYGAAVARSLVADPTNPLAPYLHSFLIQLMQDDRATAQAIVDEAIATGNATLTRSAAQSFVFKHVLEPRDRIALAGLLQAPDEATRIAALWGLGNAIEQNRPFVIEQIANVSIGGSSASAHAVAQLLRRDESLIGDLPMELLTRLVNECVEVPELEDYDVEHFLAAAAALIPDVVVRLLLSRIERAHENDREGFKPLPFHRIPIKRDLLVGHAGYEQLLREIRDALRPKSWQRHEWVPGLFRTVAQLDDARTLHVLGEWVDSGDAEKVEDVAQLLTKAPPSFVFDQADFVARLLEAAMIGGVETEKRVRSNLTEPLISQLRSGGGGEPFPQDIALRNRAREAAARFMAGSQAARFYRDIERYAEGQIRGKLLNDEEIYDE